MKKSLLLLFMVFFSVTGMLAQRTVSGVVTDAGLGDPLIGATVAVPGTVLGTVTDLDGSYSIEVPDGSSALEFSYTGFATQTLEIPANNTLNVALTEGELIDEVVVTALGIERKKDEDLSSSTLIKTDAISRSGEAGVVQGLAGKTSGVSITQNSGDPGAGAFIQIRGQNTILGSGSPLVVVDGVPISNSSIGGGTDGVVQQSRFNDIPASDIESVTVLKGAAAAAIWGSGAANGVIVVKTKKGSSRPGSMSVEVNASVGIDKVNREHEKQSVYGQGAGGSWSSNAGGLSWGDKIADRSGDADVVDLEGPYFVSEQTGNKYYNILEKNSTKSYNDENRDLVFRDGLTQNYSIGLSYTGADESRTYLGYSRLDQKGIINGTSDYLRNTFRLNHSRKFSDKLTGRINASFAQINSNRIQTGSNLNGLYLGYLRTSPDFDNRDYSGTYYTSADDAVGVANSHRSYRNRQIGQAPAIYNNPGWTINKQKDPNTVNRFIFTPELNYKITDGLSLTARYGLDYYVDNRENITPVNSAGGGTGSYSRSEISEKVQNFNLFLNGQADLAENIGLNYIFGYQIDKTDYSNFFGSASNFLNQDPSKVLLSNATADNISSDQFLSSNAKNGVYGLLQFDAFDGLLLEASGRLERSATLSDQLNFYPSISAGYVLTNDSESTLSFAKLRASYGEVGIEPPLYVNKDIYSVSGAGSVFWGDYLSGSNYGGSAARGSVQGNPDLKVERVKEFEIGGDFRFFKNALTLGATYYNRVTEDALLEVEVPSSTGYSSVYDNAAEITNSGVELDANYNLFSSSDLEWNVFGNFTANRNIVTKLPGVSRYILSGFTSTSSALVEGEPFAAIYSGRFLRDENGDLQLGEDGFPLVDPEQGVVGNPNPDFRAGLGSRLTYKGVSFSFQFETAQGQEMWGGTQGVLKYFGIHPETAVETTATQDLARYSGGFGGVIKAGETFRGSVYDFGGGPVALEEGWYRTNGGGFGAVGEQFVTDASWTKLREVSVSYALPANLLEKTGLKGMEVGFTGRNLLLWTDFAGVDPEVNLTGASKGRGLDYFTNPATKSYLFNVRLNF